jgi:hypothetical protein
MMLGGGVEVKVIQRVFVRATALVCIPIARAMTTTCESAQALHPLLVAWGGRQAQGA